MADFAYRALGLTVVPEGPMHSHWVRFVTEGLARAPSWGTMHAAGQGRGQRGAPRIGVISVTGDHSPCSSPSCPWDLHSNPVIAAGDEVSIRCSTISASDGASTNDLGSRIPRASRELIADCVELVMRRHHYDGVVAIAAGDRTSPGVMMALARLNLPSVFVYGGASASGAWHPPEHSCAPTVGLCERQFAADTMQIVAQALGLSPFTSMRSPTGEDERSGLARLAGEFVLRIVDEGGPLPRDLMTRKGLENACAAVAATGGSTNAILHLPAIAQEAGVSFTVHDLSPVAQRAMLLAGHLPGEKELTGNRYDSAAVAAALKSLLAVGALHRDTLTIDAVPLHTAFSGEPSLDEDSCQTLRS